MITMTVIRRMKTINVNIIPFGTAIYIVKAISSLRRRPVKECLQEHSLYRKLQAMKGLWSVFKGHIVWIFFDACLSGEGYRTACQPADTCTEEISMHRFLMFNFQYYIHVHCWNCLESPLLETSAQFVLAIHLGVATVCLTIDPIWLVIND